MTARSKELRPYVLNRIVRNILNVTSCCIAVRSCPTTQSFFALVILGASEKYSGDTLTRFFWAHNLSPRLVDELMRDDVGWFLSVAERIRVFTKIKGENHPVTGKFPYI